MVKGQLTTLLVLLYFAVIIKDTSSEMFHIVTSSSSPCPGRVTGEPCLTLQQYVSIPSRSPNITLEFEAGTHNLVDSAFGVSNIASFEMVSVQGATVKCSSLSRFRIYMNINSVQKVHISSVNLVNCSISVNNANHVILEDSYISESTFSTRRVGHAMVRRTSFSINGQYSVVLSGTAAALLENCTFFDSVITTGSIWVTNFNNNNNIIIRISQCTFTNITGTSLYVEGNRNTAVSTENSAFDGNKLVLGRGGIVYVRGASFAIIGSNFTNNHANGNGGVIIGISVDLSVNKSNFINNKAGGNGGAVYVQSPTYSYTPLSNISIDNSNFINNTANMSGGALYTSVAMVSISQSSFINNRAMLGGGGVLYSRRHSTEVSLVESTFINNSAVYCGVLEVDEEYNYTVNFIGSVFINNKAKGQATGRREGGVLCARNSSVSFLNSSFSSNSANGDSGVGYIEESTVTILESTFNDNVAGRDGGVFKNQFYVTVYTVSQSTFTQNRAGVDGGVMYVGRAGSSVSVSTSTFGFNRATERGGIVTILGGQLDFTNTNIYNNTAYWGSLFSGCNSHISTTNSGLFIGVDPIQPLCLLYYDSNITIPQEDIRHTEVITTATESNGIPATVATNDYVTMYETRPDLVNSKTTLNPSDDDNQTNKDSSTPYKLYATTTQALGGNKDSDAETSKSVYLETYYVLTIVSFIISITLLILVVVLYIALVILFYNCKLKVASRLDNCNCKTHDLESKGEIAQMESLLTSDKRN